MADEKTAEQNAEKTRNRRANARPTAVVVACLEVVISMMEETPLQLRAVDLLDELDRSLGKKGTEK